MEVQQNFAWATCFIPLSLPLCMADTKKNSWKTLLSFTNNDIVENMVFERLCLYQPFWRGLSHCCTAPLTAIRRYISVDRALAFLPQSVSAKPVESKSTTDTEAKILVKTTASTAITSGTALITHQWEISHKHLAQSKPRKNTFSLTIQGNIFKVCHFILASSFK